MRYLCYLLRTDRFICFFACFLFFFVPAFAVPTVGIFSTAIYVYENEGLGTQKYFRLPEVLQREFNIVLIDYNLIYSDYLKKSKKVPLEELIENVLKEKGVKNLILPADFYNLHMPPLHPTATKCLMYDALLKLVRTKKVAVFGICGGTQQSLNASGIRISSLYQMGITELHKKEAFPRMDDTKRNSVYPERLVRKVFINPASKVARIISQTKLEVTPNGWLIFYIPELHSEGIALDKDNLKALREGGYSIVGFSEDGVIEVVEDQYGNLYFQPHIESFLLEFHPAEIPEKFKNSVEAAKQLFIHFIES